MSSSCFLRFFAYCVPALRFVAVSRVLACLAPLEIDTPPILIILFCFVAQDHPFKLSLEPKTSGGVRVLWHNKKSRLPWLRIRVEGILRDVEQRLVLRRRRSRSAWVHEVLCFPVLCELEIGADCTTFEPRFFIRKALYRNIGADLGAKKILAAQRIVTTHMKRHASRISIPEGTLAMITRPSCQFAV